MSFIKEFIDRGYFYQCTDIENLTSLTNQKKIVAYIGFDCTAKSLHVGSLMQIMILRLLQQYGHKPIIIVGGATSRIGDPTGKDEARNVLSDLELEDNLVGIVQSLSKFLRFGSSFSDAILLNNASWLEKIGYIEMLSLYGRHFSVNRMLSMDSVKTRLDRQQPLTFLEFNYMILQSYDFLHLNKEHQCVLQLGGSDQWGNIVMGVDFVKKLNQQEVYGLTTPLLTTSSGVKMGKSVGGAVWLNEDMLTPYEYYQYWRNCEDADVLKFAKLYCEFSKDELCVFEQSINSNINDAKKHLAHRITAICHGIDNADSALKTSVAIFENKQIDHNLNTISISQDLIDSGIKITDLLFITKLTESKSDSKRLVRGGGIRVNDQKIDDENFIVNQSVFMQDQCMKLSLGKKQHVLVKIY